MENRLLVVGLLIILLVGGMSGVSGSASDASNASSRDKLALPQEPSVWQQVNSSGFGDPVTAEVSALRAFNGYLYAGTFHPIDPTQLFDGAQIFRSQDGVTWDPVTQPGFGDPHDTKPPAILDLTVFNSRLYASTGRGGSAGQIWRSNDGAIWAPMVVAGFGDPDTKDITALTVYNGAIYAGATNLNNGAQIWSSTSGDSNTWTQVAPAVPGTAPASITGFTVFGGALYAAVESDAPAQIWRYDGVDWTTVVSDGFGDSLTTSTGGMAEFGGYLYVGAGNTGVGAQLWRSNDGTSWGQAISPGFGDPNNQKVETVFVFQNQLYASVKNAQTGIEVWRTADGTLWEQANLDGFGDSNNTGTNWSNATAGFLSQLYIGTVNTVDGGELWRMQDQQTQATSTPTPTSTSTSTATATSSPTPTPTATTYSLPTSTPTVTTTPLLQQLHLYLPIILRIPASLITRR